MQLPDSVRCLIEERADAMGFPALKRATSAMSDAYREGRQPNPSVEAYLVTRMPATFAASHRVLSEIASLPIGSILDLGAGTGAAALAARQIFPHAAITMVERNAAFSEAARQWLPDATVLTQDLERIDNLPPHDLVISAYAIGELHFERWERFWKAARQAFVAIEPGTPRGYRLLMRMRKHLLAHGAHMLAPCPHQGECPLGEPDWCHFAARVERSSLHRRLKGADLGYEDEKFSYLALSREPVTFPQARVIRRPSHQPGLIQLETCTPRGLSTIQIRKRDRDLYREARQAVWGGTLRTTASSSSSKAPAKK